MKISIIIDLLSISMFFASLKSPPCAWGIYFAKVGILGLQNGGFPFCNLGIFSLQKTIFSLIQTESLQVVWTHLKFLVV